MGIINEWSKSISHVIKSSFNVSSSIANHASILGDSRESFIRDILKRFLPNNIIIGSGQIVDDKGNKSKQIDIIIYRNDFPILRTFGSSDVYLIEGVISTIEVKSQLNEETLYQALENGKSVRNLIPSFLKESLNRYSNLLYSLDIDKISPTQQNSIMGMILPSTYVYAYKGYAKNSLNSLKSSIEKWHNYPDKCGEQDVMIMPEVIITEGCVVIKNLSNWLNLNKVPKEELNPIINSLNNFTENKLDYESLCQMLKDNKLVGFDYGMAIKTDDAPLQYLISNLLDNIFARIGQQQLGQTSIQYNLLGYHLSEEMEDNWEGLAINITKVHDPKLEFYKLYNNTQEEEQV